MGSAPRRLGGCGSCPRRSSRTVQSLERYRAAMEIQAVGVVGAGVMGVGVAQNLAQTGHQVVLVDVADAVLAKAREEIRKGVRFQGMFKKGAGGEGADAVLSRIRFTTDVAELGDVDFVIENATEKWDVKKGIYERIDAVCPERAVFAANTSAIPITRIASATRRAPRVLGMHFMNPVPLKTAVEVIRGYHTSDETLDTAKGLLAKMGKEAIVVNDSPGFVSNRVLMLTVNEAIFLVQDGVATAEQIDHLFKSCFGHKMGPLETADLIGLDTILYSIEVLHECFNDSKYRPCPLLKKMVDAGLHGRKNGKGFYDYGVAV
ncbi:MAG TPA: 3-hydroxyacyl-CoA dehydrogenase NAD-binding domain-containing protein [Thermoanaerobaculia bacterium]|nr:3-hydroxyacyl-CoA dehydrogenase NAD-binding domain-containing protein [Thermoanaerobaculia bacterium]